MKGTTPRAAVLCAVCAATLLSSIAVQAKPKPKPIPGGANQVQGLSGKVGDMLFTGQWRFQVTGIQQIDSYTLKVPSSEQDFAKWHDTAEYDNASYTFTPKVGNTLIAVDCYVKNAQKSTEQLDGYSDDPKTALTDDQSNSYPPIVYDMITKGGFVTKPLLPGSGEKLTVLFAVPTGTKPQNLIFTLKNWALHKGKEVRVKLAP